MTRESFHEALARMEFETLELGELAGAAVHRAVDALLELDEVKAKQVIEDDDQVDDLYLTLDQGVLNLLALQSPVAADLRLISAILHSSLHLERIGDQAVNIAKIFLHVKDNPTRETMRLQIGEMGELAVGMVRTAMEAFAKRDLDLCLRLPGMDDPLDRLNRQIHLEALKAADDQRALDWGLHMNLVARALERVGDNSVDIGEQVGFLITGEFREFTDASHEVEAE